MKILQQLYASEWQWFKSSNLKIFLVMILMFFAVAVVSHTYLIGHPELAEEKVMEIVKALMEKLPVLEVGFKLFIAIFLNNLFVATLSMIAGLIPFLFAPVWAIMINAIAMGIISSYVYIKGLDLLALLIFGIAPHGIFEIPAFIYAGSLGVLLSLNVFRLITNMNSSNGSARESPIDGATNPEDSFMFLLKRVLRTWLLVVVPLLLIAAAIETFITPHLVQSMLGGQSIF